MVISLPSATGSSVASGAVVASGAFAQDPAHQGPAHQDRALSNPFFAFDNGVGRGNSTPVQQATMLKELGYGGIGYTWEHSAHIWLRRAMFNYAWMGSPAVHRARAADLAGW